MVTKDEAMTTKNIQQNQLLIIVRLIDLIGTVYSNLTGRFPPTSSGGNKYILVFYSHDLNSILAEPLKSRAQDELLRAIAKIYNDFSNIQHAPTMQIMDNEYQKSLKAYLKGQVVAYQLVPPHLHRNNATERAIATFKNHFIAILVSLDPAFLMYL